jgi:hypothetical protein
MALHRERNRIGMFVKIFCKNLLHAGDPVSPSYKVVSGSPIRRWLFSSHP